MGTIVRKTGSIIIIAAVILLGLFAMTPDAYASDQAVRKPCVTFQTYNEKGVLQRSFTAYNELLEGDRCKFYPYMSDSKVQISLDIFTACTFTSLDPDIVEIRQLINDDDSCQSTAELICRKAGNATVQIDIPADETYEARTIYCDLEIIKISRLSLRFFRRITADGKVTETAGTHFLVPGETDNDSISFSMDDCGAGIRLEGTEGVNTVYSSSDESILTIDSATGDITLKSPGQAIVTADVPEDNYYKAGKFHCKITVTPSSSEAGNTGSDAGSGTDTGSGTGSTGGTENTGGTGSNGGTAATPVAPAKPVVKTAAVTVPKLTKPTLKCSKRMKKANKLTWSKVAKASGYQLYIKYPGKKKYVKALTKNSTVKSVTHRGLKRKKYYYYKLRAYVKVGGKYYYGPFSKAIKVKVK